MTDTANRKVPKKTPAPVNDPALAALHQMFGYFDRNTAPGTAKPEAEGQATAATTRTAA